MNLEGHRGFGTANAEGGTRTGSIKPGNHSLGFMSLYDTMAKATEQRDATKYTDLFHPDYEFVRHQSGTSMNREQMTEMMKMMMANEKVVIRNSRCIYENEDILVEHSVMDFPDGTTEAVLSVHSLENGQILRTETGATLLT